MKNIWILNHYASPPQIGSGIRHFKFAENLIKKGYNIKIFTASSRRDPDKNMIKNSSRFLYIEYNKVPFIFIRASSYEGNGWARIKNMFSYAAGIMSVSKSFDNEKPDVIYASSVHPLTWVSGYRLARRYNAEFIAETRDLWPETLVTMNRISRKSIFAKLLYRLEKFIYKRADKLIFTFPGGREYIKSIGLDASKVRYINNGVDLEEFNKNSRENIYEDIDLDNDKTFKIIYTGSMGISNALNYLLEAAAIIQLEGLNDIRFLLFGDGYLKGELMNYIRKNNIQNVIFKNKVEKKYIAGILCRSNLNIFTGQPIYLYKYGISLNKMFDYFASGKPTLSNLECGYDLIREYKCGITVKGGSAEALAEGILEFYNMPGKEYDNYCKNALKAAQDFDYKVLSQRLESIILEE